MSGAARVALVTGVRRIGGAVAPGMIVVIYGSGLGPDPLVDQRRRMARAQRRVQRGGALPRWQPRAPAAR